MVSAISSRKLSSTTQSQSWARQWMGLQSLFRTPMSYQPWSLFQSSHQCCRPGEFQACIRVSFHWTEFLENATLVSSDLLRGAGWVRQTSSRNKALKLPDSCWGRNIDQTTILHVSRSLYGVLYLQQVLLVDKKELKVNVDPQWSYSRHSKRPTKDHFADIWEGKHWAAFFAAQHRSCDWVKATEQVAHSCVFPQVQSCRIQGGSCQVRRIP